MGWVNNGSGLLRAGPRHGSVRWKSPPTNRIVWFDTGIYADEVHTGQVDGIPQAVHRPTDVETDFVLFAVRVVVHVAPFVGRKGQVRAFSTAFVHGVVGQTRPG